MEVFFGEMSSKELWSKEVCLVIKSVLLIHESNDGFASGAHYPKTLYSKHTSLLLISFLPNSFLPNSFLVNFTKIKKI